MEEVQREECVMEEVRREDCVMEEVKREDCVMKEVGQWEAEKWGPSNTCKVIHFLQVGYSSTGPEPPREPTSSW